MRRVTAPGRWVWRATGLATVLVLAVPGFWLIARAGMPAGEPVSAVPTRTVIVTQPVTSLDVRSYGAPVQVSAGSGSQVRIVEAIMFNPDNGPPPAVRDTVADGRLTLDAPACAVSGCGVGFTVTVPGHVSVRVATDGGAITVSGTGAANLDSGGGPVQATRVDGPLTVSTEGGALTLNGVTGPLNADTGGGPLLAQGVAAATAAVSTDGGVAQIGFISAPDAVSVDSGGGPQQVGIATEPAAPRSIRVVSDGGPLQIESAGTGSG
jgi:hypothetical protein